MIRDVLPQEYEVSVVTLDEKGEAKARSTHPVRQFVEDLGNGVHLELVMIPGGAFLMGSFVRHGYIDEQPQRRVSAGPFLMGKFPVTQEQWQTLMGKAPSRFKGARLPVDNISWKDASRFCERLSKRTGHVYRLPSEAQWEYACRAGTTGPFHFGETLTTAVANYNGEFTYQAEPKGVYRHSTTEVGSFPPNAFGLFDMHGNVWEWCADPWHDTYEGAPADDRVWQFKGEDPYRAARGGCWHDTPDVCRSTTRLKSDANSGDEFMGFRVAMVKPTTWRADMPAGS
jgi:formylglycine-generating enzyme required for sulfatase activity